MNTEMKDKESIRDRFVIFLKGVSMGLADIVPGVSGGTIALITGIYERLIFAIKSINPEIPLYILRKDFKKAKNEFLDIDFPLLVPLLLGIGTAFLIASRFILTALNKFPAYTYSFFFGLISASAILIYKRIGEKNYKALLTGFLGFLFAFWLVGQEAVKFGHNPLMVFLSGFIAICAMILPGISGSFMLLLIGQYKHMLGAVKNFSVEYPTLFIFITGAIISILTFSRILSYLLKKHKPKTLAFLTGLMVGALRLPFEKVINVTSNYSELNFTWTNFNILFTFIFAVLGLLAVFFLETDKEFIQN